jgi:protein-tyrosine phosphatase
MSEAESNLYNFGPAMPGERIVYGASRPGYGRLAVPPRQLDAWIDFMASQGIGRICCLLSDQQMAFYEDLLGVYAARFGDGRVCWAPIPDFHLVDVATLCDTILPFLAAANVADEPVVVHCSAGSGRTGHVLAAWLVFRHGMDPEQAADTVVAAGRDPYEAEGRHHTGAQKLYALLDSCRALQRKNLT